MRCKACQRVLSNFQDDMCHICIKASEETFLRKDYEHSALFSEGATPPTINSDLTRHGRYTLDYYQDTCKND